MYAPLKTHTRHPVVRVLVVWVIQVMALLVMDLFLPGLQIDSLAAAVAAVAVIGLLNAFLWPIMSYVTLPFTVLTLGLFSLVLNGLLVDLAGTFVPGFDVAGIAVGILVTLGMTAVNAVTSSLLTIDDENAYYRNVIRRVAQSSRPGRTAIPGFLFLEIDGLARPVLDQALRRGYMPNLAGWLARDGYQLLEWETDLSSQTSASQAGILHGNNDNIPGFRWYEKETGRIVTTNSPAMVAELEAQISDGNGLLASGGVSRGNLFSGDASRVMATASVLADFARLHTGEFYAYFMHPYNVSRTVLLFLWEIVLEKVQFWQARRHHVQPCLGAEKRGGAYPLLRASMTVIMRELNMYTLIGDVFSGVPAAYATFVGYDEVAHHSGVTSPDAFDVLRKLDQQLPRLQSAVRHASRPYHLVLLSDHGQSGGATFKQRYRLTLRELVDALTSAEYQVQAQMATDEGWGHLNVFLTEAIRNEHHALARPLRRAMRRRTFDGDVVLGPEHERRRSAAAGAAEEGRVLVLASGNLGLIYFKDWPERLTLEEIEVYFPGLLAGLTEHEGIGFLLVYSAVHGPMALGAHGVCYLTEERVVGENPLTPFGPNAAVHLRRAAGFQAAPDIYVNGFYDPQRNEVAAFEELIGSHGGLGGDQTRAFILFPAGLPAPDGSLVGAEAVYYLFKDWMAGAGTLADAAPAGDKKSRPVRQPEPMRQSNRR